MANRTAPCRICGKSFIPCSKSSGSLGAFNYREIACSPECGKVYFQRVQENRNIPAVSEEDTPTYTEPVENAVEPEKVEQATENHTGKRKYNTKNKATEVE